MIKESYKLIGQQKQLATPNQKNLKSYLTLITISMKKSKVLIDFLKRNW